MTNEEKELLIKCLCDLLPYNTIVQHSDPFVDSENNYTGEYDHIDGWLHDVELLDDGTTSIIGNDGYNHICDIEHTKPYLRPMSSMTEDEIDKFTSFDLEADIYYYILNFEAIDYLNSIHVDYRGLIGKELALEAPEDMYK